MFKQSLNINKRSDSIYTPTDTAMTFVTGWTLGTDRIMHFEDLEEDSLLRSKLGLNKLPDYTLLYKELDRFCDKDKIKALKNINREVNKRALSGREWITLDIDSSVETVYGQQELAEVGYNHTKPGRKSYHPVFAFDGKEGNCINAELRTGNAASSTGFQEFYNDTESLLPESTRIGYVRMDKGFSGQNILSFLEDTKDVGYVAKLKVTNRLKEDAKKTIWQRIASSGNEVIEFKEFGYKAVNCDKHRKVILVRKKPIEEQYGQLKLFDEWEYHPIVTNLDWDAEDIWHFYNSRATSENYIKELKHGFAIDKVPGKKFYPNYADLFFKVLAYNCFRLFQKEITPSSYKSMTVSRMRRYFFMIPGVIVNHARKLILKLKETFTRQTEFMFMRKRLGFL